jgi:glucose-6-phosphate 1-dehydrogenase
MHDTLFLFGATGDLAQRYLFPSLLRLLGDGLLPEDFRIRALALSGHDTEAFHDILRPRLQQAMPMATQDDISALLRRIDYRSVDLRDVDSVAAAVADLVHRKCVSYLAIPPGLYISTCEGLAKGGALAAPARLMLEKPIGSDSESAEEIISTIGQWIDEDRVFRLDHYLGKAAVQNLIALRFGNTLLEAVWNRNYIESVHILVAESEGVDGRDAYYARSGALRDMVQSHILQLLCMVAMEPPASLEADRIRDEKVKVLRALRPLDARHAARDSIRGRYTAGTINGQPAQAYQPPEGSDVETFAGVTAHIDNWRWSGVPFHLVTGKRLPERTTRVVVTLKPVTHWLFERPQRAQAAPNRLVFQLQPQENIELGLMSSLAGPEWGALELHPLELELSVPTGLHRRIAYERLFLDAFNGNHTLFVRDDEVRAAWAWIDSVADAWKEPSCRWNPTPPASGARATQRSSCRRAWTHRTAERRHECQLAAGAGRRHRWHQCPLRPGRHLAGRAAAEGQHPRIRGGGVPVAGDAARHHLEQIGATASRGVFAVAGRVDGDEARITNHPWVISRSRTAAMLGFDELHLINDFAAQAMAISLLQPDDVVQVGGAAWVPGKPGQPQLRGDRARHRPRRRRPDPAPRPLLSAGNRRRPCQLPAGNPGRDPHPGDPVRAVRPRLQRAPDLRPRPGQHPSRRVRDGRHRPGPAAAGGRDRPRPARRSAGDAHRGCVLRRVRRHRRRPGTDPGRLGRRVPDRRTDPEDARFAAALRVPPALRAQGPVLRSWRGCRRWR